MNEPSVNDVLIGRNIRNARELQHFTQSDVAFAMHTSRTTISAIEHGRRPLRVNELTDLACVLRCDAFDVLLHGVA